MKKKEKILQEALRLFNEKGVDQVSALQISRALEMSYGNLTYHFKNKEEIILTLYRRMHEELNTAVTNIVQAIFEDVFELPLINAAFETTWKYRFIYLNISSLMFQFDTIRSSEKEYADNREKILTKAMEHLIKEGLLKPETHTDYKLGIHTLSIILYSWIIDAELFYTGPEADKIDTYVSLFCNSALPNFTEEGVEKFNQIKAGLR